MGASFATPTVSENKMIYLNGFLFTAIADLNKTFEKVTFHKLFKELKESNLTTGVGGLCMKSIEVECENKIL